MSESPFSIRVHGRLPRQPCSRACFPRPADAGSTHAAVPPLQGQFEELRDTWTESINRWSEFVKEGGAFDFSKPESLRALFVPERWLGNGAGVFDAGLRQVLEGPKYATLFDLDRKLLELRQLAMQRDKDVATFQAVLMKGWNAAFEKFSKELASSKEKLPSTWRGMTDRWLSVVNDTMIDVHRTDEFVEAQRRMLRSASDYRLQERKIAEAWCDAMHIPTRSEMDEVQRTVTELRRAGAGTAAGDLGADARCGPTSHARQEADYYLQPAPITAFLSRTTGAQHDRCQEDHGRTSRGGVQRLQPEDEPRPTHAAAVEG